MDITPEFGRKDGKFIIITGSILILFSFLTGLSNSIMFYETLPDRLEGSGVLVFYQPTCSSCVEEIPEIRKLIEVGVPVAAVNIIKERKYITEYNIDVTPSFLIVTKQGKEVVVKGKQTFDTLYLLWLGSDVKVNETTGCSIGGEQPSGCTAT